MTNLLLETEQDLKENKKCSEDVIWVGSSDGKFAITWQDFAELAKKVNYNSGFGAQEISTDLVIVGDDWWLERTEYDGSESWSFKLAPVRQENWESFTIVAIRSGGWKSLEMMNSQNESDEQ